MQPNQLAELADLTAELNDHAEAINQMADGAIPDNYLEAYVDGNTRPVIKMKFNPRGQIILDVLKYAIAHDLRVRDVWQLHRDLPEQRDDTNEISSLIRLRLEAPDYPTVYAEAPRARP